jgi:predicted DNA-binding antitoxin AbrB/MazE fold protein
MSITVDATYVNGVLKPAQPLPLKDQEQVRVTIDSKSSPLMQAYGIMGWTGSPELADRFALAPEFDPQEDA